MPCEAAIPLSPEIIAVIDDTQAVNPSPGISNKNKDGSPCDESRRSSQDAR
jgi:hypothetical protein